MAVDQIRLEYIMQQSKISDTYDDLVPGVTRNFTCEEIEGLLAKFCQERGSYAELYSAFWQACQGYQELLQEREARSIPVKA